MKCIVFDWDGVSFPHSAFAVLCFVFAARKVLITAGSSPTFSWLFLQSAATQPQPQNLGLGKRLGRGIAKTPVLNWPKGYLIPFSYFETFWEKEHQLKEDEREVFKRADRERRKVATEEKLCAKKHRLRCWAWFECSCILCIFVCAPCSTQ